MKFNILVPLILSFIVYVFVITVSVTYHAMLYVNSLRSLIHLFLQSVFDKSNFQTNIRNIAEINLITPTYINKLRV